jgi:hypothetical protein
MSCGNVRLHGHHTGVVARKPRRPASISRRPATRLLLERRDRIRHLDLEQHMCSSYERPANEDVCVSLLLGDPDRPEFSPTHPWGCHRRRVPDRVVFKHVIAALVQGSGYERITTLGCSDRTIRCGFDRLGPVQARPSRYCGSRAPRL